MVPDKSFMINTLLIKGNLCPLATNDILLDLLTFYKKECHLINSKTQKYGFGNDL